MDTNRSNSHTRVVGPLLLTLAASCLLVIACGQAASPPQAPGTPAVELPAATVPPTQPPVVTVTPDHTIEDCMRVITSHRIRHLPVVSGDDLVGMISIGDLVKSIISAQAHTIDQLSSYIEGRYPA